MATHLSEHFTLEEATFSREALIRGIDNLHPAPQIITTASKTAVRLEKVRSILQAPMNIGSWIRCPELNAALGSKSTSQHIKGEAVDFTAPMYGTPFEICLKLREFQTVLRWDQLILEHSWVHISWNSIPSIEQRGEVLSLLATGGYAYGLTDKFGTMLA